MHNRPSGVTITSPHLAPTSRMHSNSSPYSCTPHDSGQRSSSGSAFKSPSNSHLQLQPASAAGSDAPSNHSPFLMGTVSSNGRPPTPTSCLHPLPKSNSARRRGDEEVTTTSSASWHRGSQSTGSVVMTQPSGSGDSHSNDNCDGVLLSFQQAPNRSAFAVVDAFAASLSTTGTTSLSLFKPGGQSHQSNRDSNRGDVDELPSMVSLSMTAAARAEKHKDVMQRRQVMQQNANAQREQNIEATLAKQQRAAERKAIQQTSSIMQRKELWLTMAVLGARQLVFEQIAQMQRHRLHVLDWKGPRLRLLARRALRRARQRIVLRSGVPKPSVSHLLQDSIFALFPEGHLAHLQHRLQLQYFFEGECVIIMGSEERKCFVLAQGNVDVMMGDVKLASVSRAGTVLGSVGMVTGEPRTATVVARTPCFLWCGCVDDFEAAGMTSNRVEQALDRISELRLSNLRTVYKRLLCPSSFVNFEVLRDTSLDTLQSLLDSGAPLIVKPSSKILAPNNGGGRSAVVNARWFYLLRGMARVVAVADIPRKQGPHGGTLPNFPDTSLRELVQRAVQFPRRGRRRGHEGLDDSLRQDDDTTPPCFADVDSVHRRGVSNGEEIARFCGPVVINLASLAMSDVSALPFVIEAVSGCDLMTFPRSALLEVDILERDNMRRCARQLHRAFVQPLDASSLRSAMLRGSELEHVVGANSMAKLQDAARRIITQRPEVFEPQQALSFDGSEAYLVLRGDIGIMPESSSVGGNSGSASGSSVTSHEPFLWPDIATVYFGGPAQRTVTRSQSDILILRRRDIVEWLLVAPCSEIDREMITDALESTILDRYRRAVPFRQTGVEDLLQNQPMLHHTVSAPQPPPQSSKGTNSQGNTAPAPSANPSLPITTANSARSAINSMQVPIDLFANSTRDMDLFPKPKETVREERTGQENTELHAWAVGILPDADLARAASAGSDTSTGTQRPRSPHESSGAVRYADQLQIAIQQMSSSTASQGFGASTSGTRFNGTLGTSVMAPPRPRASSVTAAGDDWDNDDDVDDAEADDDLLSSGGSGNEGQTIRFSDITSLTFFSNSSRRDDSAVESDAAAAVHSSGAEEMRSCQSLQSRTGYGVGLRSQPQFDLTAELLAADGLLTAEKVGSCDRSLGTVTSPKPRGGQPPFSSRANGPSPRSGNHGLQAPTVPPRSSKSATLSASFGSSISTTPAHPSRPTTQQQLSGSGSVVTAPATLDLSSIQMAANFGFGNGSHNSSEHSGGVQSCRSPLSPHVRSPLMPSPPVTRAPSARPTGQPYRTLGQSVPPHRVPSAGSKSGGRLRTCALDCDPKSPVSSPHIQSAPFRRHGSHERTPVTHATTSQRSGAANSNSDRGSPSKSPSPALQDLLHGIRTGKSDRPPATVTQPLSSDESDAESRVRVPARMKARKPRPT